MVNQNEMNLDPPMQPASSPFDTSSEPDRSTHQPDADDRAALFEALGPDNRYRLRLALFGAGVIAAIVIAFVAGITTWQDYIVKDRARDQLRAQIVVKPQPAITLEEGGIARVQGTYYNLGQTPAYDEGASARIIVSDYPQTETFANEDCSTKKRILKRNKWYVGKTSVSETVREVPFTRSEITALKEGKAAIYFHGRVCYSDIFDEAHHTDFCLYWKWDAGRLSPGLFCSTGNSSI